MAESLVSRTREAVVGQRGRHALQLLVRAEWSKGWAYSGSAAWADPAELGTAIPDSLRVGQGRNANWDTALVTLDRYDPGRIFSNTFLETLMPRRPGARITFTSSLSK